LTGDPVVIADPVGFTNSGFGGFSVSASGQVAYRAAGLRQLKWFDRAGKAMEATLDPDAANLWFPELSPDGERVALVRTVQDNGDIWLMDLVRRSMSRFTFDPAFETAPVWSPNGTRIVFASSRKGRFDLFVKPSNGGEAEDLLLETPNNKYPQDWSKDGQFLLYSDTDPKTGRNLYALPIRGATATPMEPGSATPQSIIIANTPFEELNGQFSPDGRWVAYETNESGRFEIVVQPFPVPKGKWQVSTGGGVQPRWRADGKELYFIGPERKLMAVSVTASSSSFAAGTPVALFPVAPPSGAGTANKHQYMVSSDGRFLVNTVLNDPPITVLLNWKPPRN
jgi:Tol biopolymer transport system component